MKIKTELLQIRMSKEEKEALRRDAKFAKMGMSLYARTILFMTSMEQMKLPKDLPK